MLEVISVDAGYDGFQALFDVSLEIKSGEAVAVIGPNGAGKTTLMRVISGLIRPMQGAITMEGADLLATPAHRIVERRAANVRDRSRPDVEAQAPVARRTVGRSGAGSGAAGVRAGRTPSSSGIDRADRRAECPAGAARRRSRLPARGRLDPVERHRRRSARQRSHSGSLSRRLTAASERIAGDGERWSASLSCVPRDASFGRSSA